MAQKNLKLQGLHMQLALAHAYVEWQTLLFALTLQSHRCNTSHSSDYSMRGLNSMCARLHLMPVMNNPVHSPLSTMFQRPLRFARHCPN